MPTASSKHFYTQKDSSKKTLRQVVRPTYKRAEVDSDDLDDEVVLAPRSKKPTSSKSFDADSEISEINRLIAQATERLKQIEEQKQEALKAEEQYTQEEEEVEFDGADDFEEQLLMVNAELNKTRRENRKLQSRIEELEEELKHQETKLTKAISSVAKEVVVEAAPAPRPPLFSFSQELSEALKAIDTLASEPDGLETEKKKFLTPSEQPSPDKAVDTVVVSAPVVSVETKPEASQVTPEPEATDTSVSSPPASMQMEKPAKQRLKLPLSPKKKREKKLLVTATILLATLSLSSIGVYMITKPAGVDDALVADYLANSSTQVLGEYDQIGVNKDGIVANKDADEAYEATQWSEYRDTFIGVKVDYPASVVERLHSTSTITFMRKDSYLMKIMQVPWNDTLEAYWEQNQNSGVAYTKEESEYKNHPALMLTPAEPMEYPTNRILVKVGSKLFDILYAAESDKFSEDDFKRVDTMLQSIRFIQ